MTTTSPATSPSDGWILVSNNLDNSLELTGIVHHVDGCGMNNGRNQLVPVTANQLAGMKHCLRCEAVLGIREPVSRPTEGTKVEVRLPPDVLADVDRLAQASRATRAATLRSLIEAGLAAPS
ncbi:CopG family transcriptional regulator [Candidatus Poriferisodalis sp.]|uniref:ribbon-helix-helix domain-containing protein n=1 Tax=Candidatus Poriferisodalis sp. TaxID=3101277 RepID=UPI003B5BA7F6